MNPLDTSVSYWAFSAVSVFALTLLVAAVGAGNSLVIAGATMAGTFFGFAVTVSAARLRGLSRSK